MFLLDGFCFILCKKKKIIKIKTLKQKKVTSPHSPMRSSIEWTQKNSSKASESLWVKKNQCHPKKNNKAGKKKLKSFFFFFLMESKFLIFPFVWGVWFFFPLPPSTQRFFVATCLFSKKKTKRTKKHLIAQRNPQKVFLYLNIHCKINNQFQQIHRKI